MKYIINNKCDVELSKLLTITERSIKHIEEDKGTHLTTNRVTISIQNKKTSGKYQNVTVLIYGDYQKNELVILEYTFKE